MKNFILILLICLLNMPVCAEEDKKTELDFKKPVMYSSAFMAVGYIGLVASDEIDNPSLRNFKAAFEKGPQSDDNSAVYNFILHPLWGSETYLRAREANFGPIGSILFSMTASVVWEYLIESWSQHPSSQDLIATPVIGWMLGEIRYKWKQNTDGKVHWLIDPINTTLEHLNVGVAKGEEDSAIPFAELTWAF